MSFYKYLRCIFKFSLVIGKTRYEKMRYLLLAEIVFSVWVTPSPPRRNKLCLFRFFLQKISQPLHCSSFFTKSHTPLICSLVNALTTPRCRCQLFAILACFLCKFGRDSNSGEQQAINTPSLPIIYYNKLFIDKNF